MTVYKLTPSQERWKTLRNILPKDFGGVLGIILTLMVVIVAIFAPLIAPYDIKEGSRRDAKLPPAWYEGGSTAHLLGTDVQGWDIYSRILHGARVSVTVGLFGVLLASTIGLILGTLAAYFGGWVDTLVNAFVNVMLSIPYLVLVIVVATVFGRSLLNVILIFGITDSPVFIRLVRGEVLRLREQEFIQAAESLGAQTGRILGVHVMPNLIGILITLATFEMSAMIFYEAGLSFLGLSVPPDIPSWGNMVSAGRRFLITGGNSWIAVYPGVAIALTALGINLLGDWLRDVFDPRSKQSN